VNLFGGDDGGGVSWVGGDDEWVLRVLVAGESDNYS
jgi:hypothetical protein